MHAAGAASLGAAATPWKKRAEATERIRTWSFILGETKGCKDLVV